MLITSLSTAPSVRACTRAKCLPSNEPFGSDRRSPRIIRGVPHVASGGTASRDANSGESRERGEPGNVRESSEYLAAGGADRKLRLARSCLSCASELAFAMLSGSRGAEAPLELPIREVIIGKRRGDEARAHHSATEHDDRDVAALRS